jgi:PhnB protein
MVKPVPEGFHTLTPYLVVDGAAGLIEFVTKGFGGELKSKHALPTGRVMHASMKVGDSMLMLADAPEGQKAMKTMLYVYVPDTDAVYKKALAAGAKSLMEPADQFYGDRNAGIEDPCGNQWWIATHREDMSDAELLKRAVVHGKK